MKKNIIAFLIGAMAGLLFLSEAQAALISPVGQTPKQQSIMQTAEANQTMPDAFSATLHRLGLPTELGYFNGILEKTEESAPVFKDVYEYRFNRATMRTEKVLKSRTLVPRVTKHTTNIQKAMALNNISEKIVGTGYSIVDANTLRKEFSSKLITTGPQAGKIFWFGGGTVKLDQNGYIQTFDSPYRNAEKDGSPSAGWRSFEVFEQHNRVMVSRSGGVVTETVKTSYAKTNVTYTKAQMEEMGYSDDMISDMIYIKCELKQYDPETHLLNVSTDLEQLDEMIFWPNVYLNGKDDDTFDFERLVPHYATKTPDFIVRIRAYDDRTNADYAQPNYSGMGNFGKCMDIPFENENVKPIRVELGNQFGIQNLENELVVTFKESANRLALGLAIEYKPLDGKKVENEMYFNLKTGQRTLNIFDLG